MGVPIRLRHNENINLTSTVTDELHTDVGVAEFKLSELIDQDADGSLTFGYDMFCDMVINDAAGGSGTELVVDVDYLLLEPLPNDHELVQEIFTAIGLTKTVYTKLQIISASFQTGNLYFSYTGVADDNSAEDLTNVTPILITKSAAYTQTDQLGFPVFSYTCGTATKIHTLPTVADNKNAHVRIIKADTGYGPILVKAEGSETINGLPHVFLWSQNDCIELMSTGSGYIIVNDFKPYFYSGWISCSDWTDRHLGFATIVYDTLVGTIQIGDKVTGANGSYGIVIYDNGSMTCIIASCVTVGETVFANNEVLTFDLSGATAAVDMASGLKNVDSNIYHGWNKVFEKIFCTTWYSTNGTDAAGRLPEEYFFDGSNQRGQMSIPIDTNSILYQTGAYDSASLLNTGSGISLRAQDYFYNQLVKLIIW